MQGVGDGIGSTITYGTGAVTAGAGQLGGMASGMFSGNSDSKNTAVDEGQKRMNEAANKSSDISGEVTESAQNVSKGAMNTAQKAGDDAKQTGSHAADKAKGVSSSSS